MKLGPDKCVIRFCRQCGNPMKQESYEWDSDYRWYGFHCISCNYDVKIGENITQDIRSLDIENGDYLEPLTKEELKWQNSPESEKTDERMFEKMHKDKRLEDKKQKRSGSPGGNPDGKGPC